MYRFFPHTEYTEDQPYARTILTTHVAARAFTLGSGIGLAIGGTSHLVDLARARSATKSSLPSSSTSPLPPTASGSLPLPIKGNVNGNNVKPPPHYPLPTRLLRSSGFSSLFTSALLCALILPYQMSGREPIEWQDRTWRLLENKGQMEVDEWTGVGAGVGLVGGLVARQRGSGMGGRGLETGAVKLGVRGVVGAAGVGSLVGLAGYFGWRYGWKGGKWDEDEDE
ncbi:uncharacterized protein STEHIDRAFT_170471 [Stereum hirsutum FP-91666 SS1]|uniref:uncharacterized protein n=1 Tax=Stereum hirsutum (strain FP-91666) TaxID=721885 RepID=UPI0004449618|nr:uncharacterized protein STEHIDRAFT_170471 [Stereum hirsutum FP-91666 SS1]EIM84082.1 hypothetical protein STEHIDRAFT_170471 [Stereum hirsutum FP-91666 SS1]